MSEQSFWYELKLGETYEITKFILVTRVPGGWIYSDPTSCVFIPYDTEFKD
jgi:hypothetical protein